MSLNINCESAVIYTTAEGAFLSVIASNSMIMDFHVVYGDSIDQGHLHGLRQQHRLWSSTWPPEAAQTPSIIMALAPAWTGNTNMASGNIGHGPWQKQGHGNQHGFRQQHGPLMSTLPQQEHRQQTYTQPPVEALNKCCPRLQQGSHAFTWWRL